MKPGLVSWLVAIGPLVATACTHYVGRGSDLYYQGRYIEAAHVLEKSEQRLPLSLIHISSPRDRSVSRMPSSA